MNTRLVNTPPALTFRWLGMNGTEVTVPDETDTHVIDLSRGERRTVRLPDAGADTTVRVRLAEGACLNLVQIRPEGSENTSVLTVEADCGKDAQFHWYRVVTGGGKTYDACTVRLSGDGACFTADVAYRLAGDDVYDAAVTALHSGRKTESTIFASGVLSGQANKLFRGTIDLRKGAKGAVGNETEDVLLLSDDVRNGSLPVILCSEEDVEGNHGASIGQPDEELLYYLQTRGIGREEALAMLAQAKIDAVLRKIPD